MNKPQEPFQLCFQVLLENVYCSDRLARLKRIYELIVPCERLYRAFPSSRGDLR